MSGIDGLGCWGNGRSSEDGSTPEAAQGKVGSDEALEGARAEASQPPLKRLRERLISRDSEGQSLTRQVIEILSDDDDHPSVKAPPPPSMASSLSSASSSSSSLHSPVFPPNNGTGVARWLEASYRGLGDSEGRGGAQAPHSTPRPLPDTNRSSFLGHAARTPANEKEDGRSSTTVADGMGVNSATSANGFADFAARKSTGCVCTDYKGVAGVKGAAPHELDALDRNLECPICLDPLAVAAILDCGHSVCWACAHEWCSKGTSPTMDCPACHVSVRRGDFRRSVTLDKAVEAAVRAAGLDGADWDGRLRKGRELARSAEETRRDIQDKARSAEDKIQELKEEVKRLMEEREQQGGRGHTRWGRNRSAAARDTERDSISMSNAMSLHRMFILGGAQSNHEAANNLDSAPRAPTRLAMDMSSRQYMRRELSASGARGSSGAPAIRWAATPGLPPHPDPRTAGMMLPSGFAAASVAGRAGSVAGARRNPASITGRPRVTPGGAGLGGTVNYWCMKEQMGGVGRVSRDG
ncbi:unnamed protein product, partial [Discosporangium mesarthrocarpum]